MDTYDRKLFKFKTYELKKEIDVVYKTSLSKNCWKILKY